MKIFDFIVFLFLIKTLEMMRTPTGNSKDIVRSNTFQIGSTPPTPKVRRGIERNASQISNILNNHSM